MRIGHLSHRGLPLVLSLAPSLLVCAPGARADGPQPQSPRVPHCGGSRAANALTCGTHAASGSIKCVCATRLLAPRWSFVPIDGVFDLYVVALAVLRLL